MKNLWMLVVYLLFAPVWAANLPLPAGLIDLQSSQGQKIFLESSARAAFWPLSAQFVTQETQSYCGMASLVMVLNNLPVATPVPPQYAPFKLFTQDNLLTDGTDGILPRDWLPHHGMTIDQLGALAQHFGAKVTVVHATNDGLAAFRRAARQALATPGQYVVVNFERLALQEVGYGHISPLAAYDAKTDRFLVLDVARYKYPPFWVRAVDLYAALDTQDRSNANATRGYVIIAAP